MFYNIQSIHCITKEKRELEINIAFSKFIHYFFLSVMYMISILLHYACRLMHWLLA